MGYENSEGGAQPNFRKMFRRVGMAVDSGEKTREQRLQFADELEKLYVRAHDLRLYVAGTPFHETIRAVAEQLRETVEDEQQPDSEPELELVCTNCREINYATAANKTTKKCDDCGKVGTLMTFKEDEILTRPMDVKQE